MSNIAALLKRLLACASTPRPATLDPEALSLRDWADLPAYHPGADRAPC